MTIDYSSLSQPATKEDVSIFKATATEQQNKIDDQKELALVKLILLAFTGIVIVSSLLFDPLSLIALAIPIPIAVIFIFKTIAARRNLAERRARLHKFAAANEIQLIYDVNEPRYPGIVFSQGDGRQIREALIFKDGIEIGNYEYSTWNGKNRLTHEWSYVRTRLTRRLPNMVLDARSNNIFGKLTNLPQSFTREQNLSLEGDFDKYFTLYAPKEYERDALYILTPDVMAALIDNGHTYDMEIVDDYLVIYSLRWVTLDSEVQLTALRTLAENVSNKLRAQSRHYTDARTGSRSANMIAEPGRRLTSK